MDSIEWTKIFGGVVATALFIQVARLGAEYIYETPEPEKAAYTVPGVEAKTETPAAEAPGAEALPDFAAAIPAADAMAGATIAERCAACHDWTKGGPNKIGPNLYGVVGRARASHEGFSYSPALQAKMGDWTYGDLFMFLAQPAVFVPGTKMTFAGLPRAQDRLNLIAFLREQADMPAPLPPSAAPADAPAAP
jgi:cytochrome c